MYHVNNNAVKLQKIIENTNNTEYAFDPRMKILLRITKIILESGSIGRTLLSQQTRVSYDRVSMHVEWLEKKHLVESILDEHKVKLRLTEKGRQFAELFCDLDFML